MRKRIAVMFAAALAAVAPSFADDKDKVTDRSRPERTYRDRGDADVTYGRIKELNAGRKVVIDVDNAIDKSFDLTDNDESVNMAADLKVGDPVKVTEPKVNGKKTVEIIHHAGGGVRHGDQDTAARADRVETDSDVTSGRIKEFAGGGIVIDVDNANAVLGRSRIESVANAGDFATVELVSAIVGMEVGDYLVSCTDNDTGFEQFPYEAAQLSNGLETDRQWYALDFSSVLVRGFCDLAIVRDADFDPPERIIK